MRSYFIEKFDDFFGSGCEVAPGLIQNEVTKLLWSEALLVEIANCEKRGGWVEAHSRMHYNFS